MKKRCRKRGLLSLIEIFCSCQTQWSNLAGGTARFSPHLTRLFCNASGPIVANLIIQALKMMSVIHDVRPIGDEAEGILTGSLPSTEQEQGDNDMEMDVEMTEVASIAPSTEEKGSGSRGARIRVSTTDKRKCALRGEIWIETIAIEDAKDAQETGKSKPQCHVLMKRSKGDPLEWRRLFRAVATFEGLKELIITA